MTNTDIQALCNETRTKAKVLHEASLTVLEPDLISVVTLLLKLEEALGTAQRSREGWEADASREAGNASFWKRRAEAAEAARDRWRKLARRAVDCWHDGDDDFHHAMEDLEANLGPSGEAGPEHGSQRCPRDGCDANLAFVWKHGCPADDCPLAQGERAGEEREFCPACKSIKCTAILSNLRFHYHCSVCGHNWSLPAPTPFNQPGENAETREMLDRPRCPSCGKYHAPGHCTVSPPPDRGKRWRAAKLTNVPSHTAWTVYEMAARTHFVPGTIQIHGSTPQHDAETLTRSLSEVERLRIRLEESTVLLDRLLGEGVLENDESECSVQITYNRAVLQETEASADEQA